LEIDAKIVVGMVVKISSSKMNQLEEWLKTNDIKIVFVKRAPENKKLFIVESAGIEGGRKNDSGNFSFTDK
jgi:hypothetical protein